MDEKQLDEIEAQYNGSTQGLWRIDLGSHVWVGEFMLAKVYSAGFGDQVFIAGAHKNIPELVAEVRRLKAELELRDKRINELDEDCKEWQIRVNDYAKALRNSELYEGDEQ